MQPLADLLIGEAIAKQLQHLAFAARELQRVWIALLVVAMGAQLV